MAAQAARELYDPNLPNDPAVEAAFQAVPDTMIAEIIDGELFTMTRPGRRHTRAASIMGGVLGGAFWYGTGGPGGWVILYEPELHLGPKPDKVVPDLAGWRSARMPDELEPEDAPPYYEVPPDWVCEILSPGTEAKDRGPKMRIYRREGIPHLWLINPNAKQLEVYHLESGRYSLVDTFWDDAVVRAEPFSAIEISLELLWGTPRRP